MAQHDLRRASCFDTKEEQQVAESRAIRDVAAHSFGIAFMSAILRQPFILRNWFLISTVNMFRFFHFISMAEAGYRLHLAKFGIRAPACFDNPWKSETVAEFWSKRWNMVIATQLRNVFYKPVVQWTNSKFKGALSVFAASSALHMIPVVSLGGSKAAITSTALFFLMQPALIWFESALKLKGKAWVNCAMWSTAPLFSLPLYTVL
jgi:D-alanyl-lipoteichoic acid acyltransferase DltB (MBOAT superfamily)